MLFAYGKLFSSFFLTLEITDRLGEQLHPRLPLSTREKRAGATLWSQTTLDTLRHRQGAGMILLHSNPTRKRTSTFALRAASELYPQVSAGCVLPELACDVTKSRITATATWASLNLGLTFHLIWVSMAAGDVRGKWIHVLLFNFGATDEARDELLGQHFQKRKGKERRRRRKKKSPREGEREKGGGGVYRYLSSSHKGT